MADINKEIYVINPTYRIYNDHNRVLLISNTDNGTKFTFLHPVHAILLSYFTGEETYGQIMNKIEEELSLKKENLQLILSPLIENKKSVNIKYDNYIFKFPPRIIIKNSRHTTRKDLNRNEYMIHPPYDFSTIRLNIPRSILFIINTKCYTDCTYCYADRKTPYTPLSTERILHLIEEARSVGINIFDISGGEFLLHKDWDIILQKLHDCGYDAFISTKIPISEKTVQRLVQLGTKRIQISLDSIDKNLQTENLNCKPSYVQKLLKSIRLLDENGFEIHIKSTLTKNTCTLENITQLFDFINTIKGVKSYSLTAAGYSHYLPKDHYVKIRPTLNQLRIVQDFIKKYKRKNIRADWDFRGVHYKEEYKNRKEFENRDACTGNITSFVMLPDGKVTICEELYWNKKFIIGDLSQDTILDVWNSEAATSLFKLKKEDISPDSTCNICADLEKCRQKLGVCWKNIIAYHGNDKWDYPDPTCPKSTLNYDSIKYLAYEEF